MPCVYDDSNVSGEPPRSNSMSVPVGIVAVSGLLNDTVVKPPAVRTPVILVFA